MSVVVIEIFDSQDPNDISPNESPKIESSTTKNEEKKKRGRENDGDVVVEDETGEPETQPKKRRKISCGEAKRELENENNSIGKTPLVNRRLDIGNFRTPAPVDLNRIGKREFLKPRGFTSSKKTKKKVLEDERIGTYETNYGRRRMNCITDISSRMRTMKGEYEDGRLKFVRRLIIEKGENMHQQFTIYSKNSMNFYHCDVSCRPACSCLDFFKHNSHKYEKSKGKSKIPCKHLLFVYLVLCQVDKKTSKSYFRMRLYPFEVKEVLSGFCEDEIPKSAYCSKETYEKYIIEEKRLINLRDSGNEDEIYNRTNIH